MQYNFDTPIERRNTDCVKYDMMEKYGVPEGTLAMWVADMDFQAPPAVRERLTEVAEFNLYGYTFASQRYKSAVTNWFKRRFSWDANPEHMLQTPGVVFAIAMSLQAYTEVGDAILIQEPVYHPFRITIEDNKRETIVNPLRLVNGRYEIDFEDMEQKIVDNDVKLFVLCSPHNPVGRVWTETELRRMGEICQKHDVLVVSDEIHADFVCPGKQHLIYAQLGEAFADQAIICTAASKSFNLAGLCCSNIFIANPELRERFQAKQDAVHIGGANAMGMFATEAAYTEGEAWLDQLRVYLAQNVATVRGFLAARLPEVKLVEPDGTYLLWLDFRELGLKPDELNALLINEAGVWMNEGSSFGESGAGFMRMNVACPRATVQEALERIAAAIG